MTTPKHIGEVTRNEHDAAINAKRVTVVEHSGSPTDHATSAKQQPPVTTPTVYNVTLTNANTEYSQALPANTRELRFRCRSLFDVRYSFTAGKVATPTSPWLVLPAGMDYFSDNNDFIDKTIYLASNEAGVIVELEIWN